MADTSVTVQTLIDGGMARLKDPDKTQWSDNDMLSLIQKGVNHIQRTLVNVNSELAISDGTVSLSASTQEYDLSGNLDNFWKILPNGVYFTGGAPLTPITVEDARREGSTTTNTAPTCFYLSGDKIGLVNIPTAMSVSNYPTLNCRYFAMAPVLTLTSSMPYKNLFNDAVSAFADHLAVLKTTANTAEFTALYNALEEQALKIMAERAAL